MRPLLYLCPEFIRKSHRVQDETQFTLHGRSSSCFASAAYARSDRVGYSNRMHTAIGRNAAIRSRIDSRGRTLASCHMPFDTLEPRTFPMGPADVYRARNDL